MKNYFLFILLPISVLSSGCGLMKSNTISLFNGNNLDGWEIQNDGQFSVEDGVLKINGGTGWLRSNQVFSDFTLTLEFRFLEAEANSGIFIRTKPTSLNDEFGYPDNGYQIQCKDSLEGDYPLAHLILYGAPEFQTESDVVALENAYRPTGEWQTFEITCEGENISVVLNGALVTTGSNIKNLSGHIGLQGENGLLEFRNIEVVPID